ncbi:hypothetical protein Poli38472_012927 [Pythium oligandrum]|uniref:Uncharacterized protein n=1 Tax=Pythium oligandrum TaxID=41045 RepID=A0A8K1FHV3_PYTOL|nr:hypothetical protein Poli38472_012927 [Pythium oligandrum]|eukprot:TMW64305.1 hypothetical protein Poli38472_012927 [Pythium oligandrum]
MRSELSSSSGSGSVRNLATVWKAKTMDAVAPIVAASSSPGMWGQSASAFDAFVAKQPSVKRFEDDEALTLLDLVDQKEQTHASEENALKMVLAETMVEAADCMARMESMRVNVETLERENRVLRAKTKEQEALSARLESTITSQETIRRTVNTLEHENEALRTKMIEQERLSTTLQATIATLESDVSALGQRNDVLSAKSAEYECALVTLRANIESLSSEMQALRGENQVMKTLLHEREQKVSEARAALTQSEEQNQHLRTSLDTTRIALGLRASRNASVSMPSTPVVSTSSSSISQMHQEATTMRDALERAVLKNMLQQSVSETASLKTAIESLEIKMVMLERDNGVLKETLKQREERDQQAKRRRVKYPAFKFHLPRISTVRRWRQDASKRVSTLFAR